MNLGFLLRGLFMVALLVAALLAIAGRIAYWQAWAFGALNTLLIAVFAAVFADDLESIAERMRPAPGTKAWDRAIMALFMPAAGAVFLVGAVDAGRLALGPPLPWGFYPPAYALYLCGAFLHLWAVQSNRSYRSTVGRPTADAPAPSEAGPYQLVRHPGYAGIILMEVGIAAALGSVWALVPAGFAVLLLVLRSALEDATLRRELPGYLDYARRVRFRLIPAVW
jgi:protein-S-isoprenylcysteine O-methyltransferase Ste14